MRYKGLIMKFIDFFSGVGGFTRGLELAGHECIGHCEFDKFAEASYRSMHTITEEVFVPYRGTKFLSPSTSV